MQNLSYDDSIQVTLNCLYILRVCNLDTFTKIRCYTLLTVHFVRVLNKVTPFFLNPNISHDTGDWNTGNLIVNLKQPNSSNKKTSFIVTTMLQAQMKL